MTMKSAAEFRISPMIVGDDQPQRRLYLLGGHQVFPLVVGPFIQAAGGSEGASIAVLVQDLARWTHHNLAYQPLMSVLDEAQLHLIGPDEDGKLDIELAQVILDQSTGILMCGGYTPTYQVLFAMEPLRSFIRRRYQQGVPYAGMSAGALLTQDIYHAVNFTEHNEEEYTPLPGLGLLPSTIIEAHFTGAVRQNRLRKIMALSPSCQGFGIDETACVVLHNESVIGVIGEDAFRFTPGSGEVRELRSTATCIAPPISAG